MAVTEVKKSNIEGNPIVATVASDTDDAVGMHWFVAIVHHNSEKKLAEQLQSQGIEVYIAAQKHLRVYPSGRKKWVDRLIIPSKVFIKCTEKQRLRIVSHPFIYRFLTNRSGDLVNGHRPIATIHDKEIDTLRFMLGQSDYPVEFQDFSFKVGDNVKVIRGSLKGLVGKVIETSESNKTLVIQLDFLGYAKLTLPASEILPIS